MPSATSSALAPSSKVCPLTQNGGILMTFDLIAGKRRATGLPSLSVYNVPPPGLSRTPTTRAREPADRNQHSTAAIGETSMKHDVGKSILRNMLLGRWAAEKLGIRGPDA